MPQNRIIFKDYTLDELGETLCSSGFQKYRAAQLYNWVYKHGTEEPQDMLNLPLSLRNWLSDNCIFTLLEKEKAVYSKDGTVKFLWKLNDGECIESVFLPYRDGRRSVCISTQMGCALGCKFCVTGELGFIRNLSPGEIVEQVYRIEDWLREREENEKGNTRKLTNIVFMGMGEPLLNYDAVLKAIKILISKEGFNFSIRKITLSTVGIVPGIRKLAREGLEIVLSISLHAPNNQLRQKLIPTNLKYPLEDLMAACEYYWRTTNRRITFEYALIEGVNDRPEHARQLSRLLENISGHVNLMPVNPGAEREFARPDINKIKEFQVRLEKAGIPCTVRLERGTDIQAACGQLGKETLL